MLFKNGTIANVWGSIPASYLVLMFMGLSCAMSGNADEILPLEGVYKGSNINESTAGGISPEIVEEIIATDWVRHKVLEGLALAKPAQAMVESAFNAEGLTGLYVAAQNWNSSFTPTATVRDIQVNPTSGAISIFYEYNNIPQLVADNVMVLTPGAFDGVNAVNAFDGVGYSSLADDFPVDIEWACAGSSATYAAEHMLPYDSGTVIPRYSPSHCR